MCRKTAAWMLFNLALVILALPVTAMAQAADQPAAGQPLTQQLAGTPVPPVQVQHPPVVVQPAGGVPAPVIAQPAPAPQTIVNKIPLQWIPPKNPQLMDSLPVPAAYRVVGIAGE